MQPDHLIMRVFEVRAKPGKSALLKKKLSDTSVSVVKGKPGNLGYFFGEALSGDGNELVFISVWRDMESIKAHFGESWEQSYLPEGYDEIIESCSIKHIRFDGYLDLQ